MRWISAGLGRPVELVVLVRVVPLIEVELDGGVAGLGGLASPPVRTAPAWAASPDRAPYPVDADAIAELPAEQLVHRHVQRLAGQIPQRGFHGRQHGDEHAGLRAPEDAALPNLLEQPMHVERTLVAKALAEALDEMVGALNGVDSFAAAPDALVRVDLHEQASAHVAALHIGDAQRGRADACFALSTACPNAARGRAAAAPAIAQVARNVRRPVVDLHTLLLLDLEDVRPPAVRRRRARVNRSSRHERRFRRRRSVEDQLDGVADVAVRREPTTAGITSQAAARLFSQAGAPATWRRPSAGSARRSARSGGLHFDQHRAHRRIARAFLHVGDIGAIRLKHPGLGVDQPSRARSPA